MNFYICLCLQSTDCLPEIKENYSLAKLSSHVCCPVVQYLSNPIKSQYCFRSWAQDIPLGTGLLGTKPCLGLVDPDHLSKSTSAVLHLVFSTPARWVKPNLGLVLCLQSPDEQHEWKWDWNSTLRFVVSVDVPLVFSDCWKTFGVCAALTLELCSLVF